MGNYGRVGALGIVAPWGLRQDAMGGLMEDARELAERVGLDLPGGTKTPTPTGTAQRTGDPNLTAPLLSIGNQGLDPRYVPPIAVPWHKQPVVWIVGAAAIAYLATR